MIIGFKCKNTQELWETGKNKKIPSTLHRVVLRKLLQVDSAEELKDLKAPPHNRLEPLNRDRLGQYSIRVNDQWRICFVWHEGHAYDVEMVDYH